MHALTIRRVINEAPLLFTGSLALLLVVVLLRYYVLPRYALLHRQQSELSHYSQRISTESGFSELKQEIAEKIGQLSTHAMLPEGSHDSLHDLSGFLEMLIAVARNADVRFARIQPLEESATGDFTLHPVMLALTTTYHELGFFIAELEKRPRYFRIARLALDATPHGKCDVKLLVTCLVPRRSPHD